MRPTLVPFTPWTTLDDYIDILDFIESEGLIDHVDPVQYSIRLLVPPGSLLLSQTDAGDWFGRLNEEAFCHGWTHRDRRMDDLQKQVTALVESAAETNEDAASTFHGIAELAYSARGDDLPARDAALFDPFRLHPPRLTEAWFC